MVVLGLGQYFYHHCGLFEHVSSKYKMKNISELGFGQYNVHTPVYKIHTHVEKFVKSAQVLHRLSIMAVIL